MIPALLGASFEPPSTTDFVYRLHGPGFRLLGFTFCFNFILLLLTLTTLIVLGLFYFAFRRPTVVPGKLQMLMEIGVGFVRENVAVPMLGPAGDMYLPLLAAFFFFILIGNLFEVVPGFSFSANSRLGSRWYSRMISWVTYNAVGIRKHGFLGYLKHTCIIEAAPGSLRYSLLMLIEFMSNIPRPPDHPDRPSRGQLPGGALPLAIFFLGTVLFLENGPKTWPLALISFPLGVVLISFEIFVSSLQAFIFTILAASYIGRAMAEEHWSRKATDN